MGVVMRVLPGDLVSVTAGAILRRGAPTVNRSWNPPQPDIVVQDPEPYEEGDFRGVMCVTHADEDGATSRYLTSTSTTPPAWTLRAGGSRGTTG